jgi:hypothetical protein
VRIVNELNSCVGYERAHSIETELTFEYIKLNGRLIAIDNNHTKKIFNTTRFLVLFRPNLIGYLSDRYRSIEIVHKCIMEDVPGMSKNVIRAENLRKYL